jgi:hypothetical protein
MIGMWVLLRPPVVFIPLSIVRVQSIVPPHTFTFGKLLISFKPITSQSTARTINLYRKESSLLGMINIPTRRSFTINKISSRSSKTVLIILKVILRTSRAINRVDSSLINKPENKQFKAKLDLFKPLPPYCPEGRFLLLAWLTPLPMSLQRIMRKAPGPK